MMWSRGRDPHHLTKQMTNEIISNNAEGEVVKVVSVVTNAEQIAAAGIGLVTGGPLGAVAAWGSIRALAGKWTPWMLVGAFAAPVLMAMQVVTAGALLSASVSTPATGARSALSR